jgi:hypothetical protein
LGIVCPLLFVTAAYADPVTYTYTGNSFTRTTGSYTAIDHVTGSVTLSSSLPYSDGTLTLYNFLVTSFSFTDDVQIINSQNATAYYYWFATSNGAISIWQANQQIGSTSSEILEQFGPLGSGVATSDQGFGVTVQVVGAVLSSEGTAWVLRYERMAVPR